MTVTSACVRLLALTTTLWPTDLLAPSGDSSEELVISAVMANASPSAPMSFNATDAPIATPTPDLPKASAAAAAITTASTPASPVARTVTSPVLTSTESLIRAEAPPRIALRTPTPAPEMASDVPPLTATLRAAAAPMATMVSWRTPIWPSVSRRSAKERDFSSISTQPSLDWAFDRRMLSL